MSIVRQYVMIAAQGRVDDLRVALVALATAVRAIEGCEGVAMFQTIDSPERFVFIEYWASVDAHKAGGKMLPRDTLGPVMGALAGPPEGSYLDVVPLEPCCRSPDSTNKPWTKERVTGRP